MCFLDKLKNSETNFEIIKNLSILIIFIILDYYSEGGIIGLFFTFTFFLFKEKRLLLNIIFILGSIVIVIAMHNFIQIFMIGSLIFINIYNGEKGYSSKLFKFFFYGYYISHIGILYLLYMFI